jgi:hypothetical protein
VLNRDNRRRRTPEEWPSPTTPIKRRCHKTIERTEEEAQYDDDCHAESSIDTTFAPGITLWNVSSETEMLPGRLSMESAETDLRALFMARIVTSSGNSQATKKIQYSNEVHDIIRRIIRQAAAGSPIRQICNAFDPAYNVSKSRLVQSNQNKGHACQSVLAAIKIALQDPQQRSLDSTLAAVWMIEVYEVSHDHAYLMRKFMALNSRLSSCLRHMRILQRRPAKNGLGAGVF